MSSPATASDSLRSSVRRLEEIPPLPQNTQRLLDVLSDEEADLRDVSRTIEETPPLAARIVGLSRSAFFGCTAPARSVSDAIIRVLGLRLVRNLALGIALGGSFRLDRCPRFSAEQYWSSALLSAAMCRLLARDASVEVAVQPESAYLCGLLHNLGLLALVQMSPTKMVGVLEASEADAGRPLAEIESEHLGLNHCEAGAWLALRWHLPDEVRIAIEHYHQPDYRDQHWPYSLLVGVATRWGRQRLAGVLEPWVEPESLRALGVSNAHFEETVAACEVLSDEIEELGKLLAGSS
jgi:HD-like signal output (HDOD) protein